jgi:NAD(P)-dependent dehydrogenase (short-subunit alcohol dehydrogenase family)
MRRLQDRVALISGTASGMGRAAALLFAGEGAHVIGADVDTEGGQETVEAGAEAGLEIEFVRADLADEPSVERWIARAAERFGRIDILYNNASSPVVAPVEEMTMDEWDAIVRNEMTLVFLPTKHALPLMQRGGVVINTASVAGIKGIGTANPGNAPGGWAHGATKAAVRAMTRCWAVEFAGRGIRAVSISPGIIETAANAPLREDPVLAPAAERLTLTGRYGTPEEVAGLALWLASDDGSFVNGVDITVDGGWSAAGTGFPTIDELVRPGHPATEIGGPQ